MMMLKKTYLVEGKNRELLLKRLQKSKIRVYKFKNIDEKRAEITIDSKDALKYFAICKKTWYNKLLKTGGILSPFYHMVKKPLVLMAAVVFFALCFAGDSVYTGNVYKGDATAFTAAVQQALEEVGVKRLRFYTQSQLNEAARLIGKNAQIAFVKIQKAGNKAIIEVKKSESPPKGIPRLGSDLIAPQDCTLIKLIVYSGTPLVKVGDRVSKGDMIIGAYNVIDEQVVKADVVALVSVAVDYVYRYQSKLPIDRSVMSNAVMEARLALGEEEIISSTVRQTGERQIEVIIKYEKTLCGG